MKIFLIFLLFTISLYSQDLVNTYRFNGINKVQTILEQKIQSKSYWIDKLKNQNVIYGYYERSSFILLCNKSLKILKIYKVQNGENKELLKFNNIIVGKFGQKHKEGDLITPIGVYSLKYKIIPKNTFYGPLAFVISYPNLYDKLHNHDGYGIWIHGKPLDGERGDVSKGCIVLNNSDLIKLSNTISYANTVLQIYQSPIFATKKDIASILSMLYQWRYAWEKSNFKKYLSFYDKDFKRSNHDNLNKFIQYKKNIFKLREHQKVKIFFKKITIVPYQNFKNIDMYRVSFYEKYYAPNFTFKGDKEIFVRKRGNNFKIFIEK